MNPRIGLIFTLLALSIAGCVTQASQAQPGDETAQEVKTKLGLVEDGPLVEYVRAVGRRLVAVSERREGPWRFEVVDTEMPNAFAVPGGHIYVTRGLLSLVNSEDELAAVLGHEIGHVLARHGQKRAGVGVLTAPISIAGAIAGLGVGLVSPTLGNVVRGTGQLVTGGMVIAPYSRSQENEADRIGQALAARAGYDPAGISSFMRTLEREGDLRTEGAGGFHFMKTHPQPKARAQKTAERARTLTPAPASPVAPDRDAFLGKLDGLLVGPDPAHGVFKETRFLHPDLGLTFEVPEGWTPVNTPQAAGAVSPGQKAVVALRFVAKDTSVEALVTKATAEDRSLRFERRDVGGLPAARTRQTGRGQVADITLIGWNGDVLAIVAQCRERELARFEAAFQKSAASFRALRDSERASIEAVRLRLRSARPGETAEALAKRTGSTWSAAELAVANAVDAHTALEAGRRLKVALLEPYEK